MSIIFKAEANNEVGGGHLYRSIALAKKCRDRGIEVQFIFAKTPESFWQKVQQAGFPLNCIDPAKEFEVDSYLPLVSENSLIVFDTDDFRFYSGELIEKLRTNKIKTACFTITDEYPITTDLLINPNIISQKHTYQTAVYTKKLLAPGYMIFRDEFRKAIPRAKLHQFPTTILLIFGNADSHHLTLFFLTVLQKLKDYFKKVIVVCGALNPDIQEIEQQIRTSSQLLVELHIDSKNLFDIYNQVDYAITAAGMAMWEMALFKIPQFVIPSSQREISYADYMNQLGYICKLDDFPRTLSENDMADKIRDAFDNDNLSNLRLNEFFNIINPAGIDEIINNFTDEIIIK